MTREPETGGPVCRTERSDVQDVLNRRIARPAGPSSCGHVGRRYRCFACVVGQAGGVQVAASADAGVLVRAADAGVRTRWLSGRCPAPRR